ncbi:MAG: hypothetical protein V1837_00195 [Candidatus Woesearchaeota archaeon]
MTLEIDIQNVLNVVQEASIAHHVSQWYLLQHHIPTVQRSDMSGETQIRVKDIGATPVRALLWDYKIGSDTIDIRHFVLGDLKARYFIEVNTPADDICRLKVRRFTSHNVSPSDIRERDLTTEALEATLGLTLYTRNKTMTESRDIVKTDPFSEWIYEGLCKLYSQKPKSTP